jgi:hypothetical protein
VRPADQPVAVPTVVAVSSLSWLGLVVHNLAELTGPARLGPATLVPTAVYPLLTAGWLSRLRRVAAWLLLGWGWLHAIGGGLLSVLPLPLWPYQPEQSLRHYAVHALYAVLQVPLLVTVTRYLHQLRSAGKASRKLMPPRHLVTGGAMHLLRYRPLRLTAAIAALALAPALAALPPETAHSSRRP